MTSRPLARLAVLVSGNGSNLQAVIDACRSGELEAEVAVVISNRAGVFALRRAAEADIATVVAPHQGRSRPTYDQELAYTVASYDVDLVVLAGWDRVLTGYFVAHHTTINLHPAKPGAFPGLGAIEKAFEAWRRGDITEGGVMVHYVPDEGVDDGPVIGSVSVPFVADDSLESYGARVHQAEHRLLVTSIATVLARAETIGGQR